MFCLMGIWQSGIVFPFIHVLPNIFHCHYSQGKKNWHCPYLGLALWWPTPAHCLLASGSHAEIHFFCVHTILTECRVHIPRVDHRQREHCNFFILERKREWVSWGEGLRERVQRPSAEPESGLHPTTLGSWLEPKSRVGCSTDWATGCPEEAL